MKVYALLIAAALIVCGIFLKNKAFVGKNQSQLARVNAEIDNAHQSTADAATQPLEAATPVLAVAPEATPTPEPTSTVLPEKGGMGERIKKINDLRREQEKQMEQSLNPPGS